MQVPNAENARVDQEKLLGYLLSDTHPLGRAKAEFFRAVGFYGESPDELRDALLRVVQHEDVVAELSSSFGTKYVVDGVIVGRLRAARVRTVWIVEHDSTTPRLVTAYPRGEE